MSESNEQGDMNDQRSLRIWVGIGLAILAVLALGGFLWSQGFATPADPGATPASSASPNPSVAAAEESPGAGASASPSDPGPTGTREASAPPTSPAAEGSAEAATLAYFKALNKGDKAAALSFFENPDDVTEAIVTSALEARPYTELAVSSEPSPDPNVVTVAARGVSKGTPFAETYEVKRTDQGWKAVIG